MIAKLHLDLAEDDHPAFLVAKRMASRTRQWLRCCQPRPSRNCVREQSIESPSALCYRHRGSMKTNLKTGCKRQDSGKPALGAPRSLRLASAPHLPTPATRHLSLARLEQAIRGGPVATDFPWPPSGGRLIANLELEFSSSHRKHSPLRISNRKFSRVFHSDLAPNISLLDARHSSLVTHHQALSVALLMYGSAIRNFRK
jgi:hypothetical protein